MDNRKKIKLKLKNQKVNNIVNSLPTEGKGFIQSDVDGSYTGTPSDYERPVQDADDL